MERKYVLISFNKLNVFSDAELVAGISMINLANYALAIEVAQYLDCDIKTNARISNKN